MTPGPIEKIIRKKIGKRLAEFFEISIKNNQPIYEGKINLNSLYNAKNEGELLRNIFKKSEDVVLSSLTNNYYTLKRKKDEAIKNQQFSHSSKYREEMKETKKQIIKYLVSEAIS